MVTLIVQLAMTPSMSLQLPAHMTQRTLGALFLLRRPRCSQRDQQSRPQVGSTPNFDWLEFQRFDSNVRGIWESFVNVCTNT